MRRTLLVVVVAGLQIACHDTREPAADPRPLRSAAESVSPRDDAAAAPALPEPAARNVIVQLFNWKFAEITAALPRLRAAGYSHIHVSPPQKSNERVWQWWGRYQPLDFATIAGPLGTEAEFRTMNAEAERNGIKIIVDVVANHTIDVRELPSPDFVRLDGDVIVGEQFPQFAPADFHPRCNTDDANPPSVIACWLDDALCDLRTETPPVRRVMHEYLTRLAGMGVDGFRFDAAKHIDPGFFPDVLQGLPDAYSFGEVITASAASMPNVEVLDFYDFPLTATMRKAFAFGGDLRLLRNPAANGGALAGPRAVTFVRNHDIDRGQANDRGLDMGSQNTFGIGWNGADKPLSEADIILAYAYILGREDGLPYVFVDMPSSGTGDKRQDRFDDPKLVPFIRFHNLCLAGEGGVARRADVAVETQSPNALAWQRGTDRLVVLNKAAEPFVLRNQQTSLQPGRYVDVSTGWPLDVDGSGRIAEWSVPGQTAVMFVKQE
jgi:alpha-amylase